MKTWIKLYTEILSDPKMGRMSDKLFRRTVELFLLAGKEDVEGQLPSVEDIAWSLHTTAKEIQTVIDELIKLKIVEQKSDGYLITHFEERQNSDLTRSEINRRYYEKSKDRKSESKTEIQTDVRLNSDADTSEIQTLEVEEEVEVDINTLSNDRVLARAKDPEPSKPKKRERGQLFDFGPNGMVKLSQTEYAKLCQQFSDVDSRIERMDGYLAEDVKRQRKYATRDHYMTLLNWARQDAEKAKAQQKTQAVNEYPDIYTMLKAEGGV